MAAYYEHDGITIYRGDCRQVLRILSAESINCCVTSPPYWGLRDYGIEGQLGMDVTPEEYVSHLVEVFREVRRLMRDDGTLWLNLGDTYATGAGSARVAGGKFGIQNNIVKSGDFPTCQPNRMTLDGFKPKDLVGIPWRVAFALQADGWYLRSDIIWHKPNPMPESVADRPTKAHEYIFLLSKNERYYYDAKAIEEAATCDRMRGPALHPDTASTNGNGGLARRKSDGVRNKRSVWTVPTEPYPEAHFATFPTALIEPCIKAGSPPGGTVLDPFGGSGTTAQVARSLGCRAVLIELNEAYCSLAEKRLSQQVLSFLVVKERFYET